MDAALTARGVCHDYRAGSAVREVLRGFDYDLERGAFAALMGPSGSGKSTFLHLAAGLLLPQRGVIRVGGHEVTAMSDAQASVFRRAHIGVVFQSFNLIETLSVRENIVLPARLDHRRPDAARLDELIEKLDLGGVAAKTPPELSGGEQQRVALARALFMRPELILADEPTGNLDVANARRICELLRTINETEACAILLVTHDPLVAAAASRVDFIAQGRLAASFPTRHDAAEVSARYLATYGVQG